jgi:hypothetical protein
MAKTALSSAMGVGKWRKASELCRRLLGGPSALLVDPLGFDAGDSNLYRYVNNNPASEFDPSGLYEIDVHFYMTYYIAAKIGLRDIPYTKNASQAYAIAWADQFTDVHPKTGPEAWRFLTPIQQRMFHFVVPSDTPLDRMLYIIGGGVLNPFIQPGPVRQAVIRNSPWARGNVRDAISEEDPLQLGIALHGYQDSWSHEKYMIGLGHAQAGYGGHEPDYPWADPQKAEEMAKATYDMLSEYYCQKTGEQPKTSWANIREKIVPLFKQEGAPGFILRYTQRALKDPAGATLRWNPLAAEWKDETDGRVILWKRLINDAGYGRLDDNFAVENSWTEKFLEAASRITDPNEGWDRRQ